MTAISGGLKARYGAFGYLPENPIVKRPGLGPQIDPVVYEQMVDGLGTSSTGLACRLLDLGGRGQHGSLWQALTRACWVS